MENKKSKFCKAGLISLLIIGMFTTIGFNVMQSNSSNDKAVDLVSLINDDSVVEERWVKIAEVSLDALGEYPVSPTGSGWLSTFCLDYAQVAATVLAVNGTDWSTSANARGYVDGDGETTDLKSDDPYFFVVRCVFNNSAKNGTVWEYNRYRVNLTCTGSESISAVGEYDNSSTTGDAVVSAVTANRIWINFWWDDGVDGYRIVDDGSISWSLSIYEKR